jgi:hypothetical protein
MEQLLYIEYGLMGKIVYICAFEALFCFHNRGLLTYYAMCEEMLYE